ncbi:MAG: alcohol dehydrogenase catalytic domain-containing protein, partial [Syntrophobacteria bacterium]
LVCSTDLHMWQKGHPALRCPRILGHEIAGMVVDVSGNERQFSIGDRVQVYPGIPCGDCSFCQRGRENLCPSIAILGFSRDGGFAQYLALPGAGARALNPVPHSLSFAEAALAEPLACCLNGLERTGLNSGETVLILGAGPVGCLFAMASRHHGAEKIIMVENDPKRLNAALAAGADALIDPTGIELVEAVRELSGGRGADMVVACFREAARTYPLLELSAPGGRVLMFSGLPATGMVPTDLNRIHYQELAVVGAYGCTAAQCRRAVELLAGNLEAGWLLSLCVGLDALEEGLGALSSRSVMKVCVDPWEGNDG